MRRPMTPTATNLLGLVKHMIGNEYAYLGESFGRPGPDTLPWVEDDSIWEGADMWATADESSEDLIALYRRACEHGDKTIDELDLDAPASVAHWPEERRHTTLAVLMIRMVSQKPRNTPGMPTSSANSSMDGPTTTTRPTQQRGSNIAPSPSRRGCTQVGLTLMSPVESFGAPRWRQRLQMSFSAAARCDQLLVAVDGVNDVDVAGRLLGDVAGDRTEHSGGALDAPVANHDHRCFETCGLFAQRGCGSLITTAWVTGVFAFNSPASALSNSSATPTESMCHDSDPPPRTSWLVLRVIDVTMCSGRLKNAAISAAATAAFFAVALPSTPTMISFTMPPKLVVRRSR